MAPSSCFQDKTFRLALAASLFLILVGARAVLIGFAGSSAPYMDEWDGDWGGLIRPWLDGSLTLDLLASPSSSTAFCSPGCWSSRSSTSRATGTWWRR